MRRVLRSGAFLALLFAVAPFGATGQTTPAPKEAKEKTLSDRFDGLQFRTIGPFRGGRVTAVTGVRHEPQTFYFGGTGGGVWKTTDGGSNWENVSDKDFKTGSIGAIAVSESDPNVVYVGTGEEPIRGNVSHGDGVYKSTDGGRTWKNVGLRDTRQIARVRVHPKNPDLVYVAAQGHVWGPERRARRLPLGGRRQDLEEDPLRRRQDRRLGPRDGSRQSAHPLRRVLAGRAPPVGARLRRSGLRASGSRPTAATRGRS